MEWIPWFMTNVKWRGSVRSQKEDQAAAGGELERKALKGLLTCFSGTKAETKSFEKVWAFLMDELESDIDTHICHEN